MKFELFKSIKNEKFYFRLKARNGKTILTSQGYKSKYQCQNEMNSVRKNGSNSDRFMRKKNLSRKHYFHLQAANLQIIGMSQMYTTKAAMEKGIRSVMANAPEGQIVDLTKKGSF